MQMLIRRVTRLFGVVKFKLPDLGEKIKEGTVKKMYIKEGDSVKEFQKLADVASDKQFTEITASESGVILKIYFKEEEVCQVGEVFLEIKTPDADQTSQSPKESTKQSLEEYPKQSSHSQQAQLGEILATPYVRGLLKKHHIHGLKGSGQNGRILQVDIQRHLQKDSRKQTLKQTSKQRQKQVPKQVHRSGVQDGKVRSVAMSPFEKGMQKTMTETLQIPHLYLHEEIDVTEAELIRQIMKGQGQKLTLMGFLTKTFSLALKKFPKLNSTYDPSMDPFSYSMHAQHNISIAIDSPNGLIVPNIKGVQHLSQAKIQLELERLRQLATEAKLTSKDLQGGTISLSNIGTIGGVSACPLILAPQVCIVAIGRTQKLPRYHMGQLTERRVLNVSYGCDHRIIDGATVAKFSNEWKRLIENPYSTLSEMS